MRIKKVVTEDNEFMLYIDGKLTYKKWLNTGASKVFDRFVYTRYSEKSITDLDIQEKPDLILVTAKIQLHLDKKGSRKTGIISGYRPGHVFEYESNGLFNYSFVGDIIFNKSETIEPGNESIVTVRFLNNEKIHKYITVGQKWWLHEGSNIIGEGEIIEMLYFQD